MLVFVVPFTLANPLKKDWSNLSIPSMPNERPAKPTSLANATRDGK